MEFRDVQPICLAHTVTPAAWPARAILAAIAVLILLRFIAGGVLPLSADEAYYWLWSRHLAAGYYDHPPVIAFLIYAGTAIFGDTSIGVRLLPLLLSIVATGFVWKSAEILFGSRQAGPLAALLFNLTLMVAVETMAATPDAPLIACAAGFLCALAMLDARGDGRWWLAVGIAGGLALLSKYSGFFLGLGAVAWLICVPHARRWLASPWPYLGLLAATLIFAPNLWWNATHHWMTFAFQFGRIAHGHLTARFLAEFFGAQLLLASPAIVAIGVLSLAQPVRGFALLGASILPATAYFLIHALHDRVQGNWPCFLYPALAVAATEGLLRTGWSARLHALAARSAYLAVPLALIIIVLAYAQALFHALPIGRKDPISRLLAFGFPEVAEAIGPAPGQPILTTDYETTAWLAFYTHRTVIDLTEPQRWQNAPAVTVFNGPVLYLSEERAARPALMAQYFSSVRPIRSLTRTRDGATISHYILYRAEGFNGEAVGRMP